MDLKKSFRVALANRDMNQKDLAKAMCCTEAYISQIAKGGHMSVAKLQEVCNVLDYKVWEFIRLGDKQ